MVKINELLGNRNLMKILTLFLEYPSLEISQSEIIKKTNISKGTAIKWLNYLVKNNFVKLRIIGVTNLYSLNKPSDIVKRLKTLNTLLRLNKIDLPSAEVYLYGSASRGEDDEGSDIDLLIITQEKRDKLINKIEDLEKKIEKKVNFSVFTPTEWAMMEKKDKSFYERVEKDRIRI